ncbi:hypothetical protein RJ639_028616 [Escallonia herrerae]|uniref:Mechanosensitive ion channel protein n=1 Tax=Escallonia herrerae TaxID=1293975 RepID=A0AA89BD35_9ASTE|nr:hypothetical protein RJ639_028616 [Escallonia herrerae]
MEAVKRSFKSRRSDKNIQNPSEESQVLLRPNADRQMEVPVKVNGAGRGTKETELSSQSPVWRDSSYDFSKDAAVKRVANEFDVVSESPPLSRISESPNYGVLTPREVRVSFNDTVGEPVRRRSNASGGGVGGGSGPEEEVVVCSSTSSFRRKSSLLAATKTKSRLMDPPEQDQKSRMLKSGILGRGSEIDEDDPFLDDDLPEEYKRMKFSKWTVLQLVSLILIIAGLACSLSISVLRRQRIFELELWKWELMVLVLICGRLVSGWVIRVVVFFIERNFLLRKRVLYFVYGLRNAVQNCVWLGLVLIAWQCIFDKKVERMITGKVLPYVSRIWVCLLVGTLIWLLKTLLVKVLASSFHVSTFFDRIQEALFNQYVIETLSGPPLIEIQNEQEEEDRVMVEVQKLQSAGATMPADLRANIFPKTGKVIGSGTPRKSPVNQKSPRFSRVMSKKEDEGITIDHLHRLNQKNISAWNMKRLTNIVRRGVLSTLDEQLQDSTGEDESSGQITSEFQAKAAAKKIFCNVAKPGSKYIYLEDLMRFMREDEATKAMHLFEGAGENKGISKRALKNWVMSDELLMAFPGPSCEVYCDIRRVVFKAVHMYIENKSDHWYPAPMIVLRDVEDMNRLKISVWLSHTMNHQDMGERWQRRALLVEEMIRVFKEFDIEYRMLPLDVNVRNMPALTSSRLPSNWTACAN